MPSLKKIAVVGVGLIGASLAAAFKKYLGNVKVLAVDQDAEVIKKAEKLEIIDRGYTEIAANLNEAEVVFIAVPVAKIGTVVKELADDSLKNQLIVDAGSTKKAVMLEAREFLKNTSQRFIGGHPMAGSHKSGIDWHQADLFVDAPFILTPVIENPAGKDLNHNQSEAEFLSSLSSGEKEDLEILKDIVEKIGAKSYLMSAESHDRRTAFVSHLPHLLSSGLVNLIAQQQNRSNFLELAGSGFADMTRIAGGSAELWQDIILSNRENIVKALTEYQEILEEIKITLESDEQQGLYTFLARAAEIKEN
ncbi:prephenate dehydrogenase [Halanaerobium hydrogeniformans]|uniref:Prephenate dehydrogenase n=1 Tax=Halanaerobium hydrogeniformans TaxID=656519 RepID=E4RP17_HALHG|nr:prephenate dehydrogenase [Halanaerobium hydrogeniformans]ADQ13842.1 Prephenate dehydrogenase [Halanaerobium hydrogeniformans]